MSRFGSESLLKTMKRLDENFPEIDDPVPLAESVLTRHIWTRTSFPT
jgi:hypothetical protein